MSHRRGVTQSHGVSRLYQRDSNNRSKGRRLSRPGHPPARYPRSNAHSFPTQRSDHMQRTDSQIRYSRDARIPGTRRWDRLPHLPSLVQKLLRLVRDLLPRQLLHPRAAARRRPDTQVPYSPDRGWRRLSAGPGQIRTRHSGALPSILCPIASLSS